MKFKASNEEAAAKHECAGCDDVLATRRTFLRDMFLSAAGAMVAVGISRRDALAMPLAFLDGARNTDNTVSYIIPTTDGAQIDKKNEIILVRWQNNVYAFELSCPHQNTALHWDAGAHQFECPKHHSRFQPDGSYIADSGRATRNMDRLAILRDGNNVRVNPDKLYQEDNDGPQWTAAVVRLV